MFPNPRLLVLTGSLLVGLTLLLSATPGTVTAQADSAVEHETGRIIVKFRPGTPQASENAVHAQHGASLLKTIPSLGVRVVTIPSAQATRAVAAAYARNPLVEYAEVDAFVELTDTALIPTDTYFGIQWQLPAVDAPEAWDETTGVPAILVTICDTGVSDHIDLNDNLRRDLGVNTADGTTNSLPIHYHGTFVAGMVGAELNGQGVVGVGPNVGLIPVRISNARSGGAYFSDMAECIVYGAGLATISGRSLAGNPSAAINLSYQTYSGGQISPTILNAANAAGSVVVVAAGNENSNPATAGTTDPPNILYVASTDVDGERSSFSNYGTFVDLAAPGGSVVSTYVRIKCRKTCSVQTDHLYATASGTSFAAPMVAGAAALVQDENSFPIGSRTTSIRAALIGGACDLGTPGEDNFYGAGLLNVHHAVHTQPCSGSSATLDTIAVTPISASIEDGQTQQFTAIGTYDDESTANLTSSVSWLSSAPTVATMNASGLATGRAAGSTNITASLGGVTSNSATLLVTAADNPTSTGATVQSIVYSWNGGPQKHRNLTVTATIFDDAGNPAAGVFIDAELLSTNGDGPWSFAGTTDDAGQVRFKLLGAGTAPSETCYTLDVLNVASIAPDPVGNCLP